MIKFLHLLFGTKHRPIFAFVKIVEANQQNCLTVAEVGVYDGKTSLAILPLIKKNNGMLIAIDWFKGNPHATGIHAYAEKHQNYVYWIFKIKTFFYRKYIRLLRGQSCEMIKKIPDSSLDIAFIDGDHRYKNVLQDIKLMIPKIKPGGILAGHDCEDFSLVNTFSAEELEKDYVRGVHPGVIQAVFENFGSKARLIPDPDGQGANIWCVKI